MRRAIVLTSVLVFLVCSSGCGDSHESLAKDGLSTTKEMVTVLEGVKDEASAKAAKPKLKSLAEQLNDYNARQAKLPAMTEAELKTLESKYGKEMEETQKKLMGQLMRIQFDPKLFAELNDIDLKMK